MSPRQDRDIIDLSSLRMREGTISAGIWLTYVVGGLGEVYVALTLQRSNRPALAALFGMTIVAAVVVSLLPRERIVRSRFRELFFLSWTILDFVLIVLGTLADGGTASPLVLVFFIPVVFSSMSYPLASVAAVGVISVVSYLTLAVTAGGSSATYQGAFAAVLACTGAMSAWQAQNHNRQHDALTEVSRTDPLTGCLNRRGFEERAVGEINSMARRVRRGAVLVLDVDHFKPVNDRLGHAAGDELLCWVVQTLNQVVRPVDAVGRLGGDEFAVLFPEIAPEDALRSVARIRQALSERAPASVGLATFPLDGTELEQLTRRADMRLYASRRGRSAPDGAPSVDRLSWAATLGQAVDLRTDADHEHSRAVAAHAVAIAAGLGWQADTLGILQIAAMFHDVGKAAVADLALCKPGPLSPEEFEVIKQHGASGAELVSRIEGLEKIVPWIRHSHESFDGSGYPDGLRGEAIPQASRIMLVADAFDVMTSPRPYGQARSLAYACEELKRHAGTQFDPACVEALLKHLNANAADLPPWIVGGSSSPKPGRRLRVRGRRTRPEKDAAGPPRP